MAAFSFVVGTGCQQAGATKRYRPRAWTSSLFLAAARGSQWGLSHHGSMAWVPATATTSLVVVQDRPAVHRGRKYEGEVRLFNQLRVGVANPQINEQI